MKIRFGFVSNSSSSSFIVRLPEKEGSIFKGMYKPSELLTELDLKRALKFGFRPTETHYASQLEPYKWEWKEPVKEIPKDTAQLGYCVTCNEDEVIEFLVKHNIPFTGSTHYGHRSCFFKRGDKTILWMENLGLIFEMYAHGDGAMTRFLTERLNREKPIRRESIKNYNNYR